MGERRMRDVELVDAVAESGVEADVRSQDAPVARRWRWWLLTTAAVVVVVLAAFQWVVRVREDNAIARLAAVDGVVPEIDGPLEVGERFSSATAAFVLREEAGILVQALDGSLTYQWGTGADDDPSWNKQLLGPVPALAGADALSGPSRCISDVEPGADPSSAERVVCLVTDGGTKILDENGRYEQVPATTTFVEVLDTKAGAVVSQWPAPGAQTLTLIDGQVVLGSVADADDVVSGRDLLTGDVRWTHRVPVPVGLAGTDPRLRSLNASRAGDLVVVRTSAGELQVLSSDGTVVRDGLGGEGTPSWGWQALADGQLLLTSRGLTTSERVRQLTATALLLAADGDPDSDRSLDGELVLPVVDDGSVPGMLLTQAADLNAWDDETGAPRWSSSEVVPESGNLRSPAAVVVRGRVYVLTQAGLFALDGGTGETLWHVPVARGMDPVTLVTDAHHLWVGYERMALDGDSLFTAYDFDTGAERSHVSYPQGFAHLTERGGRLVGYDVLYDDGATLH